MRPIETIMTQFHPRRYAKPGAASLLHSQIPLAKAVSGFLPPRDYPGWSWNQEPAGWIHAAHLPGKFIGVLLKIIEIGTHDIEHATNPGAAPEFIGGGPLVLPRIPQGFDGDRDTDAVAETKTIGDGLGHRVNRHAHSLNDMQFNTRRHHRFGKPGNMQSGSAGLGRSCSPGNRNPDFGGVFGREIVEPQRGQQADNALGNQLRRLGQRVVLGEF